MRTPGDCFGEMLLKRVEDQEIEVLLSRQAGDDSDGVASLLAALDLQRLNISVDEKAADFAAKASRLVRVADPQPRRSVVHSPRSGRLVPRLVTAALTVVVLMGLAGVAVASDAAVPGDPLYGLDQALERIGVNDGGLDERVDEALALAENGRSDEALAHLSDVLDETSPNAAGALEAAAKRLEPHDNPSQAVLEGVVDMLEWMAETEAHGRDFGQGVAQRARELGAGHGENPSATVPHNPAKPEKPADTAKSDGGSEDGETKASPDNGSGNSGNSGGGNSDRGGGSGGGNGPPGGTPPGRQKP